MIIESPITPLTEIFNPLFEQKQIKFFIKREDLTDEFISGNKFYKLKYNLIEAEKLGLNALLTFGGAYSNHIHATAAAGKKYGLKTIGVIRGEEHLPLNPTLSSAQENGMIIEYIDRKSYRSKYDEGLIQTLKEKFGDFYLIPEGGSNHLAIKGCAEIISGITTDFNFVCSACGTGGTLAGLILGLDSKHFALGFSVLRGGSFLYQNIRTLLSYYHKENLNNFQINLDYHFGGYAKTNAELNNFCAGFYEQHNIQIEPIYTGKMFFGLYDLIRSNFFPPESTIVAIHTGGLQGLQGLKQRKMI
ncbi:MAG: 1-aminocyclopropane-1-carboxylate deaminase/D-cysteine desulfhydrase [Ignavibacteriales bacterium]|nr:1-aminocyclopropane-1-carboxylate deaminase/D-cysteine desulfhydrase [Ignavibacteriales bacterium]MBP9120024.1 1-aminocyclopropane-1-carboxylate deaminase/D-cysteine desulfhydrase [Ignavibacterium sp.]